MAYEAVKTSISKIASSDFSTKQFYAGVLDSSGQLALATAGQDVYGIAQDKPVVGKVTGVCVDGITKWVSGAAVAAGAVVMSDAQGRAVTATATNYGVGIAEQASTGAGIVIAVALLRAGKQ